MGTVGLPWHGVEAKTDPDNGEFTFTITKEDTDLIGLGNHPIRLVLLNAEDLQPEFTLTEGGQKGEFSKVQVVQV